MKKLVLLFSFLFIAMGMLFAQDPTVPIDAGDLLSNLAIYFMAPAGVAGVVIFITEILIRTIKIEKGWIKIGTAWLVSLVVVALARALTFGFLGNLELIEVGLWGLGFGFIANLMSDIPTVKTFIGFLMSLIRLRKPA